MNLNTVYVLSLKCNLEISVFMCLNNMRMLVLSFWTSEFIQVQIRYGQVQSFFIQVLHT
jgi:hypothetical protein